MNKLALEARFDQPFGPFSTKAYFIYLLILDDCQNIAINFVLQENRSFRSTRCQSIIANGKILRYVSNSICFKFRR